MSAEGPSCYASYTGVFTSSAAGGCWATGTSVKELAAYGVPPRVVVVGKPLLQADAGSGFVSALNLGSWSALAKSGFGWNAGVATWQWAASAPTWLQQVYPPPSKSPTPTRTRPPSQTRTRTPSHRPHV
jgi:hypothetical protein